jgi:putative transcriptional regulator
MIKSQLKVILAQRQVSEKPPYTIGELATATGLSRQTLYNLANNVTTRYDNHVLDAICRVLEVDVGTLLVHIPDEGAE